MSRRRFTSADPELDLLYRDLGDIVDIPSWTTWQLHAHDQLDVFSTSDAPVLDALGLYREEEVP